MTFAENLTTGTFTLESQLINPQTGPINGRHSIIINLYKNNEATAFFTETHPDTLFLNGSFKVEVGTIVSLNVADISPKNTMLGIVLNGEEAMVPVSAVPISLLAFKATSADSVLWQNVQNQPLVGALSGTINATQIPDGLISNAMISAVDASKITGNVRIDNSQILINNANISDSAAIAPQKIALTKTYLVETLNLPTADTKLSPVEVEQIAAEKGFLKTIALNYITNEMLASGIDGAKITGTIQASINDNSITSAKINNGAIINEDISENASISPTKIALTKTYLVDTLNLPTADTKLSSANVEQIILEKGFLKTISPNYITNEMLASGIDGAKIIGTTQVSINDNSITSTKIANSAITNAHIADNAGINPAKITLTKTYLVETLNLPTADTKLSPAEVEQIAAEKGFLKTIAPNYITNEMLATGIDGAKIMGTIQASINDNSITSAKIANSAITNAHIADNAGINPTKIALTKTYLVETFNMPTADTKLSPAEVDQIVQEKGFLKTITPNYITNEMLASGIDGAKIMGTIQASINDNSVTSAKIANSAITNGHIEDNAAIAFNKLSISKNDIVGLGIPSEDTKLTEEEIINFVSNKGYLKPNSAGNVGIGTTNPEAKLHILSTTIGYADLTKASILLGTKEIGIGIDDNEIRNKGGVLYIGTIDNNNIDFGTTGQNGRMVIDGAGNVGIGTINPDTKLDVNGDYSLGINQGWRDYGWGNALGGNVVFVPGDFAAGEKNSVLEILYPDNNTIRFGTDFTGHLSGGHYRSIQFGRDNAPYLTIKDGGNVGIGTATPKSALDVKGAVTATGYLGLDSFGIGMMIGGDGANALLYARNNANWAPAYIDAAHIYINAQSQGKVGIGTINPDTKLDVNGDYSLGINQGWRDYGWGNALGGNVVFVPGDFAAGEKNSVLEILYPDNNTIRFGTDFTGHLSGGHYRSIQFGRDNEPYLTIKDGGNVGIGVTNPDAKLVVNGTIKALQIDVVPSIVADYVFEPDYKLMPLSKVEAHIKAKKHLPNVPSEKEIKAKGIVNLGDFQMKLLEKIEELTLYTIEQDKRIGKLEAQIKKLQKEKK